MKHWEIRNSKLKRTEKERKKNANLQELDESVFGSGNGLQLGSQLLELQVRLLSHNSLSLDETVSSQCSFMEFHENKVENRRRELEWEWEEERGFWFCFIFFFSVCGGDDVMLCSLTSLHYTRLSIFEHSTEINSKIRYQIFHVLSFIFIINITKI